MIVESIVDIVEHYLLVDHNNDELVALHTIINDVVFICFFWYLKYVCNASVVKLDGSDPREGCIRPDDLLSCITLETDKPPTCVKYALH